MSTQRSQASSVTVGELRTVCAQWFIMGFLVGFVFTFLFWITGAGYVAQDDWGVYTLGAVVAGVIGYMIESRKSDMSMELASGMRQEMSEHRQQVANDLREMREEMMALKFEMMSVAMGVAKSDIGDE